MADKDSFKKPLPKFGSWDVNNPAAAGQYSMIFDRARNEKRTGTDSVSLSSDKGSSFNKVESLGKQPAAGKKWLCCYSLSYAEA